MRSVSAAALFVAISLVTACSKATPPSEAEIQAQANTPATTPTPAPPPPVAAAAAPAAGDAAAPATATAAAAGAPAGKAAAPAAAAVDLANAQSKMIVCKACHNMTQGGPNGVGPNLFGVTARKAGSQTGYTYSDAFLAANIGNWSEAKLDKWLDAPMEMVPGTKMAFPGVKNAKDRHDIIGFLETLK